MTGTKAGGLKARNTIQEKHGKDFYKKIGTIGGSVFREAPRWFALHPDIAKTAGYPEDFNAEGYQKRRGQTLEKARRKN